jgi:class 3 adenylate cyclase/ADP-ribose pyrophosphatase YjhB (NUDIX family)
MARRRNATGAVRPGADPPADVKALVVFVDIRDFTGWSDTPEVFSNLEIFVGRFNNIIQSKFNDFNLIKELGDGAMMVKELQQVELDPISMTSLLSKTLETIRATDEDFAACCKKFQEEVGHETNLHLGWGIVRGKLRKIGTDYVGSNVNKCARLCDEARPFGVMVDKIDFSTLPESSPFHFFSQTRKLSGLQEAQVWVTPEIKEEFLPREKLRERPEVHVAGTCVERTAKGSIRLLIPRRISRRSLVPGKYEGCGGQLAENETFDEGVARHFRKEMGIEIRVLTGLHCFYVIREPNEPVIPGIRFLCEQTDDRSPSSIRHTEVKWVSESDFRKIPSDEFVGSLKDEVLMLLQTYKKK